MDLVRQGRWGVCVRVLSDGTNLCAIPPSALTVLLLLATNPGPNGTLSQDLSPTPSERGTQVGLPPSRSKISFTAGRSRGRCVHEGGGTCSTKSVQSPPRNRSEYARPAAVI